MRFDRLAPVFAVAGIGCFVFAGFVEAYLPSRHLSKLPMKTLAEIAPEPTPGFLRLARLYPEAFATAFGKPSTETFHLALRRGREVYIAEACWHCHSQFVRPVANEDQRFGPVSVAIEYENEMFLPQLFGTRRVGPDLIREAGRHGVDWHMAHFWDPSGVVPASVMPRFPWFFDATGAPNERGLAVTTYVDWLGSWIPEAQRLP